MKCRIRTSFGATAAFGRRVAAFYDQIDWDLEREERLRLRNTAALDASQGFHRSNRYPATARVVVIDLLDKGGR